MEINKIKDALIFKGMSECELTTALESLNAVEKKFKKGSTIFLAGSTSDCMGLVLDGGVTIGNNDIEGNKTILSHVGQGGFFAENYGLLGDEPMLVDVVADSDCRILFLRIGNVRRNLSDMAGWRVKLISNLLIISAHNNLALSCRCFHTAPKTIRGRVFSYLNSIFLQTGKREFDIPFNRQQMADYLNLERTALSKELRKMKDDGLIDFWKNHFVLKQELYDKKSW
ncbi:MAG: Crp/Fnr family transcriptional regulator [Bacillota bacterium]|nr:Crp/Fnr family transcriptional regulator [Bacillota bacterium]